MIVLGEVQSCSSEGVAIKTQEGCFELLHGKDGAGCSQFGTGDRIVLSIPHICHFSQLSNIEYARSMKIARNPYRYISDLRRDRYCDLIAVCTDYRPLVKTRGTDHLFSLSLLDQTGSVELKVFIDEKSFHEMAGDAREPFRRGDVLLIRNIKQGFSEHIAVISKPCLIHKIPDSAGSTESRGDPGQGGMLDVSFAEGAIAQFLRGCYASSSLFAPSKMRSIRDLSDRSFFNILGKVLHCEYDQVPAVSITDFTASPLVERGYGAFPNNMVLVIRLFGQHSSLLKRVAVGRYCLFANIRMHSFGTVLEAYMHDSLPGDAIPVDSECELREVKAREHEYYLNLHAGDGAMGACREGEAGRHTLGREGPDTSGCGSLSAPAASGTRPRGPAERRQPVDIPVVPIHHIEESGIFLCSCRIDSISHSLGSQDPHSTVTVTDSGRTYQVRTKRNLTAKMAETDKIAAGSEFRCLVLKTPANALFLVDIFVDEQEYANFLEFYHRSSEKT